MPKILHLLSRSVDEQTRQIHRMVTGGLGADFAGQTRTVGSGGELRNLPTAVLRLRRDRADCTFAWGLPALTTAVLAGHRRVFFMPGEFAGPRSLRWVRSLMGRGNITFICPTYTQQRLAISHGIDPLCCPVIQPGVDFGLIRRRGDARLRAELGLSETDYVILAPGESTTQTAHDQAVWTCGILNVLNPAYKLLIWGRGSRAKAVIEMSDRLGQSEMLKVAESSRNSPLRFEDLLPAADVCLITAAGATATLPVAVCMAAGVPIVSTVTYMLAELLEDRHTALMVPRRSPRALAQRILDLREDPGLEAKLIDTARAEAYEHFSMTRMLEGYRQLLAEHPLPNVPTGVRQAILR